MKRLFVIVYIILFSSFSYADRPLFSVDLDTINYDISNLPSGVQALTGGWYLNYIGMDYIYEKNINLSPNFYVGILDDSIAPLHENLDTSLIIDISRTYNYEDIPHKGEITGHGSMVAGLFSAARELPNRGGRSIVKCKTIFQSKLDNVDKPSIEEIDKSFMEIQLARLSSYQLKPRIICCSLSINPEFFIDNSSGYILSFLHSTRKVIEENNNILYVFSAGNDGNAIGIRSNEGLHYKFNGNYDTATKEEKENILNYVYSKLENLIIVGANDNNGILYQYSNYGEGVDITAPSSFFGIWGYDDTTGSNYLSYSGDEYDAYGYFRDTSEFTFQDFINIICPLVYSYDEDFLTRNCENQYVVSSGTSAAAPIVAGAAAILLSNDDSLTPSEIKRYLTKAPLLNFTSTRYESSFFNIDSTTIFDQIIPILNIEASMKWYEEENFSPNDDPLYVEFKQMIENYRQIWLNNGQISGIIYNNQKIYYSYGYQGYTNSARNVVNGSIDYSVDLIKDFHKDQLTYRYIRLSEGDVYEYRNKLTGNVFFYNFTTGQIKYNTKDEIYEIENTYMTEVRNLFYLFVQSYHNGLYSYEPFYYNYRNLTSYLNTYNNSSTLKRKYKTFELYLIGMNILRGTLEYIDNIPYDKTIASYKSYLDLLGYSGNLPEIENKVYTTTRQIALGNSYGYPIYGGWTETTNINNTIFGGSLYFLFDIFYGIPFYDKIATNISLENVNNVCVFNYQGHYFTYNPITGYVSNVMYEN